jgi:opacity protein-like surface antigen
MTLRRILLFPLLVLSLPLAAHAQTNGRWYLGVGAGVNVMQHEDEDAHLTAGSSTDERGEVLTATGPALAGAFGRGFHNGLRVEVEGNYRANGIKGETGLSGENLGSATERKYGVMANGLYDFGASRIRPYVGGGIGGQFVHEPDAVSSSGGVTVSLDGGTKSAFAYQFIAGAAFPVRGGLSIAADYRYLGLVGARTYTGTATIPGAGSFDVNVTSSHDKNHSVLVGIRYAFGG